MDIKEIVRIDQRIMMLEEAKRDMVNQFVAEHHPHKVGDKVACTDLLHASKSMKVTESRMKQHRQPGGLIYAYSFHCRGRIINGTGFAGERTGGWSGHTIPVIPLENKADQKEPETLTGTEAKRRVDEHFNKIAQDDHGE